ncbi:glycosyl hydrolase family 28 protein [Formosa sp. 4Alg 33]|uniref:glycosyl hydrolase family 28 protein n=1 Tax=Formosa sp. 4Alg 33 TaxID=3382189 RepID=UPI003D9C4EE8
MKIKLFTICLAVTALVATSCKQTEKSNAQDTKVATRNSDVYENIEFEMNLIPEPNIPNNTVNIKDFGAVNDGETLNSKAFEEAINAVSEKGGGTVIIPAGIWLTGPIILKSNLELRAERGAVIKFSTNRDLYPIIETSFEGLDTYRCISPIYGKNVEDIAFTGPGVWDGSGEAWRLVKKSKLTASHWKKLVASGGVLNDKKDVWYPTENYKKGAQNADQNVRHDLKTKEDFEGIRDFLRPVLVSIQNSKRVMFDGPVFQNSPAWNIHPIMVEDLIFRNVTVRNPWFSQNGDGLDVESCKNVIIENSNFDVGDDAICIKSGKDEDGRNRGIACENIIIRNNIVYHGHGGVVVGSEMSGGVKNMHVSNCTFMGTDVGLRFKSTRGRGGVVEDIYISNINMVDIPTNAISFNLYYGGKSVAEMMADGGMVNNSDKLPVTEETPQFKNISIRDVVINGAHQAVFLQGLPEMNLENIEISNLTINKAKNGFAIIDANNVKIDNVKMEVNNKNVINILNTKNVTISNIDFNSTETDAIQIGGSESENIELKSSDNTDLSKRTTIGKQVKEGSVKL